MVLLECKIYFDKVLLIDDTFGIWKSFWFGGEPIVVSGANVVASLSLPHDGDGTGAVPMIPSTYVLETDYNYESITYSCKTLNLIKM